MTSYYIFLLVSFLFLYSKKIKIGDPKSEVIIPTGNSTLLDLATKSAVLKVNPPSKAEKGITIL